MPDFSSHNAGTWFYFDSTNEKLGGVCLRELTTDEFDKIERMTTTKRKKFKRGVAYDDNIVNEEMASRMRWDFVITDWKEVQLDGQAVECTTDNKVKMMKITDFVKFVVDSLEMLVEVNKSLEEARVKNSPSSSSGNSESQIVPSA